jgi:ribose 5-phosphate isomerase B
MKFPKKIAIGSDHAGFELKETIKFYLEEQEIEIHDFGTHGLDSVDYPDFAHAVSSAIDLDEFEFGILICGTANGIAMAANKHQKVRAAVVWKKEIAALARTHNDANVICLPARFISESDAIQCIQSFLTSDFEGGRHANRVNKIQC